MFGLFPNRVMTGLDPVICSSVAPRDARIKSAHDAFGVVGA